MKGRLDALLPHHEALAAAELALQQVVGDHGVWTSRTGHSIIGSGLL